MSTEENKTLVRRFYEEVVAARDVGRLSEFVAPDYVEVFDNVRYPCGVEGAKAHIEGGHETYSPLFLTVDRQIAEGDWVVTQVTVRGIHSGGSWLGIKPTGKAIEFTCVNVDRVLDGRIVEHGGAANMLGPLLKVGAVKVVGAEDARAQPSAAPNGGPAAPVGNSGATEGPPSVS
jgi:predicted ester cyclase